MSDVQWIDTMGVGALMMSKKRAIDKGGEITLVIPPGRTLTPGADICLRLAFKIRDDESKGIGSF